MTKIGVFDSGIGGLSVLNEALRQLPGHEYVYLADSSNTPYGERPSEWVANRSLKLCSWLIEEQSCEAIVVACNTATAQAIAMIRDHFQSTPIIGVEPGIKPAAALSPNKKIGVLATQSTLSSEKFKRLLESLVGDCQFITQAGLGLVPLIEKGNLNAPELEELITKYVQTFVDFGADTLVLGCTHYPFLIPMIQKKFGNQLQVIDTSSAIIKQLARKILVVPSQQTTRVKLFTTGDAQLILDQTNHLIGCQNPNTQLEAVSVAL
ncbi:glutamate racemase [Polynucleobacter kasalickyi]|uniref:Glutamate racemase n=1 Tax=Polynucleobacter kasalickyi TaxID=1938817 RepID=A0A1W1YDA7_9BURK|nr:glutamate racemase [Polynucleobacter kasalickyi]SMC34145.1 glutamate racemase [Polynucleobacter kasalickyi]